jgi:hypothetical protein
MQARAQQDVPDPILTPLEALRAARTLLAGPERWCRSAPARALRQARRGHPAEWVRCGPLDAQARRWCAAGALVKVSGIATDPPGLRTLEAVALPRFGVGIGRTNDDPRVSHPAILACVDEAIAEPGRLWRDGPLATEGFVREGAHDDAARRR